MNVIPYNSRVTNPQVEKLFTLDRELLGTARALQCYEFLDKGSPHPFQVLTDDKLLLHCFTQKGQQSSRFFSSPKATYKSSNLKIFHTPGEKLVCC